MALCSNHEWFLSWDPIIPPPHKKVSLHAPCNLISDHQVSMLTHSLTDHYLMSSPGGDRRWDNVLSIRSNCALTRHLNLTLGCTRVVSTHQLFCSRGGFCPIIVYTLDCLRRREIFPKLIPWSLSDLLLRVEIDYCLVTRVEHLISSSQEENQDASQGIFS